MPDPIVYSSIIEASAEEVYRWHVRPAAFRRLVPPWVNVEMLSHEGLTNGSRAAFRMHIGPASPRWIAEHEEVVENRQFRDRQVRGPFRHWAHTHRFLEENGQCRLEDEIAYGLPFGFLGNMIVGRAVRRQIGRWLVYRHQTTKNDFGLHRRYSPGGPLRVAVTGSSGLIGRHLVDFLEAGGHTVYRLVRTPPGNPEHDIFWNPRDDSVDLQKLEDLDAVVHLAGESVLTPRWSEQKKIEIFGSRVRGTEHLAKSLARLNRPPRVFISASGVGYYGDRDDELLDENSAPGDDGFLSALCQEWERAAEPAAEAGIRTVRMRMGVVLSPAGGVLRSLLIPFRLGLGGRYGGPEQYLSWVDVDDVVGAIYHAVNTESVRSAVNATSPTPVTMAEFAETLGRVLSRPVFLNMSAGMVRILLGTVADDAALMSVRARPAGLLRARYGFLYPKLEDSLRHTLGRAAEPRQK